MLHNLPSLNPTANKQVHLMPPIDGCAYAKGQCNGATGVLLDVSRSKPRGELVMGECVRCGHDNDERSTTCAMCSWPFSREGWMTTRFKISRVTLDTGCVNAKGLNHDLNTLESWARQGKLVLQRSDALLRELKGSQERFQKAQSMPEHPRPLVWGVSTWGGSDVWAGPNLSEDLRQILFPTAYPLTSNQEHDIDHLSLHVQSGGDVFVTLNKNDFITRGRQESLRLMGIWVFTPVELVDLLTELYSWSKPDFAGGGSNDDAG